VILAKRLTDQHTSTLPQWALAKFIAEGCLLKHIRRCHALYAGRRERILARMGDDLAPWFEAVPTTAGFHMAMLCKVPIDLPLVIELAKKAEVGLYSLDGFFHAAPVRSGLMLGFGAIELLDIDVALDRLRDILQQVA
jgi:GntR family transcriptional regulator/MocR family aminotransferase